MKLTIIIPFYNSEKYIEQCLSSVLNQNLSKDDYEVLLIDDGSTDKSFDIAKLFCEKNENVKIIRQPNSGVSAARNRGVEEATGKFIYFVDSDDYIADNSISHLLEIAIDNALDIIEFKLLRTTLRSLRRSPELDADFSLEIVTGRRYISNRRYNPSACAYFFRRQFVLNSGIRFVEGRVAEDMLFNGELIFRAERVCFVPKEVYRYVWNPNSLWRSNSNEALARSIEDLVYMAHRHSDLIDEIMESGANAEIVKAKRQHILLSIFRRILRSDYSRKKISPIIEDLKTKNLYPIPYINIPGYTEKNDMFYTFLFNNIYLLTFYKAIKSIYKSIKHKFLKPWMRKGPSG